MNSTVGLSVVAAADPTTLLNNQISSALSLGDAQFWEETISPTTVRNELSSSDPSNPNSTSTLQKGMKWLLASISKGRDVSDFYPHVVKLVGATSLEVRKMVFMYLVQYADHDATTRELSLLSINSFQRGLADHEQLIRGLALRVLSSIRIQDILQIQILGVQKCAKDSSPYVRKCAANALAKLHPRCEDAMQRDMLLEIMKNLLDTDSSTMVLTSALVAFAELCPERLDLIHTSFRKICHLLTDMDEWGQVVVIDLLARYCRTFFKEPRGWKGGTAEKIDRERRVSRSAEGVIQISGQNDKGIDFDALKLTDAQTLPKKKASEAPQKIKRRVVKKGFYSDEEDSSTEEEVYVESPFGKALSTASAMRQRNILGFPGSQQPIAVDVNAKEDMELDEDHRLLLDSSIPLLKSRNAGVVLSVCSLHYYCGISSVKARSAIGKALVRIHRDRREIQYVVLTSIRTLVNDCPSAFAPFLPDFFVKALDPPFTRLIKIDILTSLALEPAAIEAVLKELQMYIRSGDYKFVCAAIRAVGKVVELTRIVYDRHGEKSGDIEKERKTANKIALDCLHGLAAATQSCDSNVVIGESICVMQNILLILMSNTMTSGGNVPVEDPNDVQAFAMRRILLLLVNTLSNRIKTEDDEGEESDEENEGNSPSELEKVTESLPSAAVASALWLVGEWISSITNSTISLRSVDLQTKAKIRLEVVRLIDRAFPDLDVIEKEQGIHFASKMLASSACGTTAFSLTETAICEHILAMGRVDVNPDVKDRARFESSIIQDTVGLKHDTSATEVKPALGNVLTLENMKQMLLDKKYAPSFLPIKDSNTTDSNKFRFGTLSSLVGHKARDAYLVLPKWSKKNSPKSLRDPIEESEQDPLPTTVFAETQSSKLGFYDSESGSSSSSSSGSSSFSSSESSSDGSESDDSGSSSDQSDNGLLGFPRQPPLPSINGVQDNNLLGLPSMSQPIPQSFPAVQPSLNANLSSEDDTDDSDSSTSSSSSDDSPYNGDISSVDLLQMGAQHSTGKNFKSAPVEMNNNGSSTLEDLRGLVMAPVVTQGSEASNAILDRESSSWVPLVRPELCGGLAVRARYLRGSSKAREAQLAGLNPDDAAVVCIQIQFKNKKSDSGSLRRIKITPRSGSKGGIVVKKAICPAEIPELKKGQMSSASLCIQFASASNREGDMIARFDIKSSIGGGVPVEIKPSVGELLKPHKLTIDEFDSKIGKMHGFQRVSAAFSTSVANVSSIPKVVLKAVALTPVGKATWIDDKFRMIGCLPASDDLVLVLIQIDKSKGSGTITSCCDHAVAVNSILNSLKQAV